ncbi:ATP-dependent zinc protease family protein [Endozoicomonas elysicola]|uniref:ATP-dependent zinc protease family protein n=1 Tax=Endozoicomonas elysicola TaxID=305900 RepID=UPI000379505E|nr:RimK/LysX family protein [Endozoicomonas elysicola]
MSRNLALPALLFLIMILTGCQTVFYKERPRKDDSSIIQPVPVPEKSERPMVPSRPEETTLPPAKTHAITIREQTIQTPAHLDGRLVLGINETASLPNLNLTMQAKLDTGAENSSVDARNIQFFERDGKKWVKFDLHRTSKGTIPLEQPVKGIIKIKRPGLTSIERPVIHLTVTIGEITQAIPVSLTDRSKYESPLLIGRSFMQDLAVIDVNQKFIATKSVISSNNRKAEVPITQKSYTRATIKPVSVKGMTTLGAVEHMALPDTGTVLKARIDTGALTSSIDARDIELFQKNDHDWVRFQLANSVGDLVTMEEPVTRFVRIKRHGEDSERRPVITLNAQIGSISRPTQFTLRSRENYEYPALIGARFLEKRALVDVSREYTSDTKQP